VRICIWLASGGERKLYIWNNGYEIIRLFPLRKCPPPASRKMQWRKGFRAAKAHCQCLKIDVLDHKIQISWNGISDKRVIGKAIKVVTAVASTPCPFLLTPSSCLLPWALAPFLSWYFLKTRAVTSPVSLKISLENVHTNLRADGIFESLNPWMEDMKDVINQQSEKLLVGRFDQY
jgi:hypothetical protein